MAKVTLTNVSKAYDTKKVIDGVSLEIQDKEFLVLVGSSGCGKSTLLRMIAGLEDITEGEIFIDDKCVNNIHPKDRDIAFVFQNYALYPHMTVYENIAFPLKMRNYSKAEIKEKVEQASEILNLQEYLQRKPKQLSGGQRQRVALGRAIVRQPKVFLMDEPLSNLDAKLRVQMRSEIKKLHQKLQTTFIYVTHDQTEALTMGDRIAVIDKGVIQQVGMPEVVYNNPANTFVGGFLGSPQMNFINAKLENETLHFANYRFNLNETQKKVLQGRTEVLIGIRPEDMNDENGEITIQITPDIVEMLGGEKIVYFKIDESPCSVKLPNDFEVKENTDLKIKQDRLLFFDKDSSLLIN